MYDLHRMRLLRELKHRGTLAEVANALNYSPSAVSQQLSLLAREIGEPLLEPSGRGVALTPAAEIVVAHTETILREMELTRAEVAAARSKLSGIIRLATFQTAAHTFVPAAISRMQSSHPSVTVAFSHISAEEALPALHAGDFDLVLTEQYPGRLPHTAAGAEAVVILQDPIHLAVPSDWAAKTVEDLEGRPLAMEHPGSDPREWADSVCRAAGFEPRAAYQSADVHLHVRLVEQGYAAAFLPGLALPEDPAFHVLQPTVNANGATTVPHRSLRLSRRLGSAVDPAITALADELRDTAGCEDSSLHR